MLPQYQPVVRSRQDEYFGAALVGTHSAIIGWNFDDPALRRNLLGFAVKRTDIDLASEEIMRVDWLGGYKRFASTDDGRAGNTRSCDAPFQRFRWNDYTLKPDRSYVYEIYPVRGTAGALTRDEAPLVFRLTPSREDQDGLGLFVNRGVTAAMAYLDRFRDLAPEDVPNNGAYDWLSRGLKESLLGFIDAAEPGDALHVAIYEFHDLDVAAALVRALGRQVEVAIVYDWHKRKHASKLSDQVLDTTGLHAVATKRTKTKISHNKVVVHLKGGVARAVWTGSANFSHNAFYLQTNAAMIVRDPEICKSYEVYFQALAGNPAKAQSKTDNQAIVDAFAAAPNAFADRIYFSPVRTLDLVDTVADLIGRANSMVLMSSPFGLGGSLVDAIKANGSRIIENGLVNTTAKGTVDDLRFRNTRFYPPTDLETYMGRRWDARAFGQHKIHAKTVVIDPFGDNPQVLIGSANFSRPSCQDNDENALLISGDKRLAAVMATEFMRMFDHYNSRFWINKFAEDNKAIDAENKIRAAASQPLLPLKEIDVHLAENDDWSKTAFDPQSFSHKCRDREVFSGLS